MKLTAAQTKKYNAGRRRAKRAGWAGQIKTHQDRLAVAEGCYFDARFADHAQNFFEKGLVHATGRFAGEPFILQDWQRDRIIRPLFGWRRADGSRRFRTAFIFLPKKNGKTTLTAGIMLYILRAEPDPTDLTRTEQAAEIYIASTSAETGSIAHREMAKLVRKSRPLAKSLRVMDSTKRIIYPKTTSFTRVLPHKADTAEGMIAQALLYDEIHAMQSRKLYAALRWAGAARTQPLGIEITTAGVEGDLLWVDRYNYSKSVQAGEHADTEHLVFIAEGDPKKPLDDRDNLAAANPSAGVTISLDDLVKQAKDALAGTPNDIAQFKRYRLNIAVGAEQAWIPPTLWDKGQSAFELEPLEALPCYGGLDLAMVSDFSALCLLWPPEDPAAAWRAAWWFWIADAQLHERAAVGDMRYQAWADAGLIKVTDGDTTDHQVIRADINTLAERFNILQLGIDRGFEGWQFCQDLFNDDELPAVGIGQGWRSQDVPMQQIEAAIKDRRMNGGGNPLMRWMIGNAIASKVGPNQNYHLNKAKAINKVDGVAALINAMNLALAVPEEDDEYDYCPL